MARFLCSFVTFAPFAHWPRSFATASQHLHHRLMTGPPYGKQVDMWSAGVICYVLLSGSPAFQAQKRDQLFKLIVKAEFSFTGQLWDRISADAKDLISKLLVKSPKKRYTAQDALGHQWLKDSQPDNHLPNLQARLGTFNARAKLKGAVYGVEAAHRMLYLTWCTRTNLKPNSGVLAEMEAQGDEESEVLDLNKNYVGSKGIPAIMQVRRRAAAGAVRGARDRRGWRQGCPEELFFFCLLRTAPRNHNRQPPTANRHQPATSNRH